MLFKIECKNCLSEIETTNKKRKFCSLSCSSIIATANTTEKRIQTYNNNPNKCNQCEIILSYKDRHNSFCSQSCAATYNNLSGKLEDQE
jgi:hypothetical protein